MKKVWLTGWGSCKFLYGYTKNEMDVSCFDTYNASNPVFTDTSLSKSAQSLTLARVTFWSDVY